MEIAGVRIIVSLVSAVIAGVIISKTPWGKAIEKAHQISPNPNTAQQTIEIVKPPLDERLMSALKFGGYLVKQILPYFIIGLIIVSYVTAYTPQEIIESYLTGITGILIASVAAGPLYTPTLVEIVLGKSLLSLGMSQAALLAWLMGQPWDIPNMAAVSKITGWKVVLTYALALWVCAVAFSLLYGFLIGSL